MARKLIAVLGALVVLSMVLTACATPTPETIVETVIETVEVEVEKTVEVEVPVEVEVEKPVEVIVEVTPEPVDRQGAWLDTVIISEEPSSDSAVTRIEVGDIDVYAYSIAEPDIADRIFASDNVAYETSYGSYNEITFNPVLEFEDGSLNPFGVPAIREAMNWLIDRDYIAQEICGGLARPRFVPINFASTDMAVLADVVAGIELTYAYNPEKAAEVITAEMEALGAEMVDGIWQYNGEPVEIIGLIRTEDERLAIGDYVSNVLEDIGFTVTRDYKTSAEASPCWISSDPVGGCFNFYTGGWVSTAISRDEATNFQFFYTPDGLPFPLWAAYTPTDEFYALSTDLANSAFASMDERQDMMATALDMAMKDSVRIWLKDDTGVAPHKTNVTLASDLSGSIYGSQIWGQTMKFTDQVGGSLNLAMPSIMTEPWNPIAGTNWVYDMMPIRGTQGRAVVPDPFTGLNLPMRLAKAEVVIETGLPVVQSLDWATLEFADEIVVPDDAWADWDAESQTFITAGERFTETTTAKSKVVMYYEDDFFDTAKWHDGSPYTIGDFVMFMIMAFDQAKEASPVYDEAQVPNFNSFMAAFKGWRIVSEDPFVLEYYTDAYQLDAENNVTNFRAAHPSDYGNGSEAPWHTVEIGWLTEANGEAAFSSDKADALDVEWMSYIAGPTLDILKAKLDEAQEANLIPYEPTLGKYITAEEATSRYANLQEWFRRYGHFWVGSGPFYLQKAFPVEGTLILQHYDDYPDMASRWDGYSGAPIPVVTVDGPGDVAIGDEATFDIFVDLNDEPYPSDDISMVKYLVFDATGQLVFTGDAEAAGDGYYQAVLSAELTGKLEAGSNQLAAIAVSKRALIPVIETLDFVTK
ncbi:MAG: ABC transporter substrate-binding protein [Anaerolineae bacterium]|nr:ABC transporter substrate-binding protein [Anaerolineae bacterium]